MMNKNSGVSAPTAVFVALVLVGMSAVSIYEVTGLSTANTSSVMQTTSALGTAQVVVGSPISHNVSASWKDEKLSFVLYQVLPITVYAPAATAISLNALDVPSGAFAHFASSSLTATAAGATTTLTISGAITQTGFAGGATMVVQASSSRLAANASIPIHPAGIPTNILHTTDDPVFPSSMQIQSGISELQPEILVYDPSNAGAPSGLNVSLSVEGLWANGSVQPLPSFLNASFSNSAFSLSEYQPVLLSLEESNTLSLHPSSNPLSQTVDYTIAVAEAVNGVASTQLINLQIYPPGQQ